MSRYEFYDKHYRNQDAKKFYNSAAWLKCRDLVLLRDNYLCQHCLATKVITPVDVVHHIKHYAQHPELGLVESNLISLCHACHNKEHGRNKKREKGKIKIIKTKANKEVF